jgi:hypothetical protein
METVMNFKRKGPKSTRAGCLLCKPHKRQGCRHDRHSFNKRHVDAKEQLAEAAVHDGP